MSTGGSARRDAPTLILDPADAFAERRRGDKERFRPFGAMRHAIIEVESEGRFRPLNAPLELEIINNLSGFGLFHGRMRRIETSSEGSLFDPDQFDLLAAPGGRFSRVDLPPGRYRLLTASEFYRPTRIDFDWPVESVAPILLTLHPGYLYPFPRGETLLRGTAQRPDGGAVGGARISIALGPDLSHFPGAGEYRTDPSGQWVLRFPDLKRPIKIRVRVEQPGEATTTSDVIVDPDRDDNSLRLTALRGSVLSRQGLPIAQARIDLPRLRIHSLSRVDGRWTAIMPPSLDTFASLERVEAEHPITRERIALEVTVQPQATVIVPAFRFS